MTYNFTTTWCTLCQSDTFCSSLYALQQTSPQYCLLLQKALESHGLRLPIIETMALSTETIRSFLYMLSTSCVDSTTVIRDNQSYYYTGGIVILWIITIVLFIYMQFSYLHLVRKQNKHN